MMTCRVTAQLKIRGEDCESAQQVLSKPSKLGKPQIYQPQAPTTLIIPQMQIRPRILN